MPPRLSRRKLSTGQYCVYGGLILAFIVLLWIGVRAGGDYALSQDEPNMHQLASEAYGYITGNNPWPQTIVNRFHGPFVELTIFMVQRMTGSDSMITLTAVRHTVSFWFFCLGVLAFFFLCKRHFKNLPLAILGATFLVITPRIFAHAFYNSRDIPFLALCTLAILTLTIFLDRRTVTMAVIHGVCCAMAVSVRSMGVFLPLLTGLFLLLQWYEGHVEEDDSRSFTRITILGSAYLVSLAAFTYLFWPLLWANPVRYFIDAVEFAGSFTGAGFYFGHAIAGTPWHYVFVWIFITVPLLYSLFFIAGSCSYAWAFYGDCGQKGRAVSVFHTHRNEMLFLLWFLLPIILVTVGHGIYNEWRHVFFIYPAFLLIALEGVRLGYSKLSKLPQSVSSSSIYALTALIVLCTLKTGWWMIENHPLQGLYFSVPGSWVQDRFDLDYWGVTSRHVLEAVTALDDRKVIPLTAPGITLINANLFFPDRKLFKAGDPNEADYIIELASDPADRAQYSADKLLATVTVDAVTVAWVYAGPHLQVK